MARWPLGLTTASTDVLSRLPLGIRVGVHGVQFYVNKFAGLGTVLLSRAQKYLRLL